MEEKNEKMSFEASLARLEEIVAELERGSLELERSLTLFEEGVTLVKRCEGELDAAIKKVKLLTEDGESDFDPAAEVGM